MPDAALEQLSRFIAPMLAVREFRDEYLLIGYARVSTDDQNVALWLDAVKQAPAAGRVFRDVDSGVAEAAPPSLMRTLSPERSSQAAVSSRSARSQFAS